MDLVPIDLCIAFNGRNVDILSQLYFESFFRCCKTERLNLHLIDNGIDKNEVKLSSIQLNYTWHRPKSEWKPSLPITDYYAESALDVVSIAEWILDNCGTSKWCILSHFDILFRNDIISWIRSKISDDVGVIGTHCPMMTINREAYKTRSVGFANQGSQYDVGMLLELDLVSKGWKHEKFDECANTHYPMEHFFHHIGGGGGYKCKLEFDATRNYAEYLLIHGENKP